MNVKELLDEHEVQEKGATLLHPAAKSRLREAAPQIAKDYLALQDAVRELALKWKYSGKQYECMDIQIGCADELLGLLEKK